MGGCDVGCHWCDVKESWDEKKHPAKEISTIVEGVMQSRASSVVITGGEPTLYNLRPLTQLVRSKGIQLFLETSGAYTITGDWDWICLSPKKNVAPLPENLEKASELKMIIYNRDDFKFAETNRKTIEAHQQEIKEGCFFLQPEWSKRNEMLPLIIEYVQQNPAWRISLQTHKYIGIP
jgi:organic radical activating enzyme